ncbi:MAG: non-homologous end-joining DNA ligase, partial [Rhodanobacteraceae bacterium]
IQVRATTVAGLAGIAAMTLKEYQRKRNFKATPEPAAGGKRARRRIFVVQLHHASHRHYDFRLELDGVLKSWAVPKGPSFDPSVKRLAMEVEDHPLSYANFEGDIPTGNYGAGHVDIFDHGTWEPVGDAHEGFAKGDLKFTLEGGILRGSWVLVRTRKQGSKQQWLLIKHRDEFAAALEADDFVDAKTDRPAAKTPARKTTPRKKAVASRATARAPSARAESARAPTGAKKETLKNEAFAPELTRLRDEPPPGDDWLHEVKWDGYRLLATAVAGKVRLWSRNAIEWTDKVPEIAAAIAALKIKSVQLDGELIVLDGARSDFNRLQARLSDESRGALLYMLFDMPHLDGVSLRNVPLLERKRMLAALLAKRRSKSLRYSEHTIGNGKAVFAQATAAGLEGVVSKRIDSAYRGSRSGDWIKSKARPSDEFAVIGYTLPRGSREGIGALLLGSPVDGGYRYIGRVGTGISDEQLRTFRKDFERSRSAKEPADTSLLPRTDRATAIWVKPKWVVEVFYQGIGNKGLLRQPAFKTLRQDKRVGDLKNSDRGDARAKSAAPRKRAGVRKATSRPR